MTDIFSTRGIEKKEYTDAETGRTVLQLTASPMESKHAYYDFCPWSPDGRYIIFSSAAPDDLAVPRGGFHFTNKGRVSILDTETFEIFIIAENTFHSTHNGSTTMWHPLRNTAYFKLEREKFRAVEIETGRTTDIEGILRQLSPDAKHFASQLNPKDRPDNPETWGFYVMNADGSDLHRIISVEDLYRVTPNRDEFGPEHMTVGNPKWHPDSDHLLITMWVAKSGVRRSLYVTRKDGSDLRWLTYFGHHHSWAPTGEQVLLNEAITNPETGGMENRMKLIDFDGTNKRIVIDQPLGSHPCMDPTGTRIVDHDGRGVFVVHIAEERVERLSIFRSDFEISHRGTHPHCVWDRTGTAVLYNSAETGHSEIYMVPVEPV